MHTLPYASYAHDHAELKRSIGMANVRGSSFSGFAAADGLSSRQHGGCAADPGVDMTELLKEADEEP